ncbi:MAG TPA: cytochrome c biogenesis protein CcsA [Actinomycetota bacterium]|nr:cytochrome c biogenesis protein CcsA [Actinomycetota bacterium]
MASAGLRLPMVAVAAVVAALALAFFYAPTEAVQGDVQRLFYIHAPTAWVMYIAFITVAAASVMVLARRHDWERWDAIAVASAEVGLLFISLVLAVGPVWGHSTWGTWWVWDARLTSTLVLWLIYAGYLLFRATTPPGERRARLSAVIGLIGALDIPVVHSAVYWWRTQHPTPTVLRSEGPDLPGSMLLTLLVSMVAFTLLFAALLVVRLRIEQARRRVEAMEASVGP